MSIRVIDLSQEMADGMETYPGDALGVRLEHPAHMPQDGYNLSCFTHLACHCGTHIDSPLHFIEHGADLTEIPLRVLPAVIVDTKANPIDFEVFKGLGLLTDRAVLIRTGWDAHLGRPDYYRAAPFLTPEGAEFLAESGIALLGLD
jgi:kynurenine formamidase